MKKKLLICGLVLALVALCGGGYYFYQKHHAVILYKQAEKAHQEEAYGQSLALYKELEQNYLSYLPLYDRLMVLFHMGSCFYFDEKYESAIPFCYRGVKMMEEHGLYGKHYTPRLYSRLAESLSYTGKHSEAESVLLKAYHAIQQIYGGKSAESGLMSAKLGEAYSSSCNYKRSLPFLIETINNKDFMRNQSDYDKAIIYGHMASAYLFCDQYEEAEKYDRIFFEYARKSAGECSALIAAGYAGQAMFYYRKHKIKMAIDLLNKSYTIFKKINGDQHRDTLKVKKLLDQWSLELKALPKEDVSTKF